MLKSLAKCPGVLRQAFAYSTTRTETTNELVKTKESLWDVARTQYFAQKSQNSKYLLNPLLSLLNTKYLPAFRDTLRQDKVDLHQVELQWQHIVHQTAKPVPKSQQNQNDRRKWSNMWSESVWFASKLPQDSLLQLWTSSSSFPAACFLSSAISRRLDWASRIDSDGFPNWALCYKNFLVSVASKVETKDEFYSLELILNSFFSQVALDARVVGQILAAVKPAEEIPLLKIHSACWMTMVRSSTRTSLLESYEQLKSLKVDFSGVELVDMLKHMYTASDRGRNLLEQQYLASATETFHPQFGMFMFRKACMQNRLETADAILENLINLAEKTETVTTAEILELLLLRTMSTLGIENSRKILGAFTHSGGVTDSAWLILVSLLNSLGYHEKALESIMYLSRSGQKLNHAMVSVYINAIGLNHDIDTALKAVCSLNSELEGDLKELGILQALFAVNNDSSSAFWNSDFFPNVLPETSVSLLPPSCIERKPTLVAQSWLEMIYKLLLPSISEPAIVYNLFNKMVDYTLNKTGSPPTTRAAEPFIAYLVKLRTDESLSTAEKINTQALKWEKLVSNGCLNALGPTMLINAACERPGGVDVAMRLAEQALKNGSVSARGRMVQVLINSVRPHDPEKADLIKKWIEEEGGIVPEPVMPELSTLDHKI